ncbi:uncharacterized protein LOC119629570 [Bombyx mori]|uniref:Uncharacterized protein n=1 Tax=Bombyx mori TaxID=7091 RepID=A0A8R2R3A9_BOMMO|nr:uncharacterized protein LOC119629570 [Bombyx mori]
MNNVSQENFIFDFDNDILSQYDDNFALDTCLNDYEREITDRSSQKDENAKCIVSKKISSIKTVKGQDAQVNNNNNIAPKFGKHMKTSAKRKKFIPPTKCKKIQNNDDGTNNRSNVGITNKCLDDTFYATHQLGLNVESQNDQLDKMKEVTTNVLVESSIPSDCSQSNRFKNEYFHTHNVTGQACSPNIEDSLLLKHKTDTHYTQSCGNVKVVNVDRKTKTDSLGGLIFNSINLLNDNNLTPCAFTRESSSSTVTELSRTQSTTSVISLKTYKNLDDKSFTVNHNIPSGAEYFELFNNSLVKKIFTPVVMTVKYGDIGFNMKYSDYMKTAGPMEHVNPEVNDTINKIITMYPEENRKLLRK